MLVLVGLGNPGAEYAGHRHNVGFMAVEAIADQYGFSSDRKKFQALIREGSLPCATGDIKTLIIKPQTYMNESGRSVAEAMRFYKFGLDDMLVFHDELDLAPGKIRVKIGGGNAGHNGLRSIDAHVGNGFARVRIGIGHPGDKARVHGHVLSDFAKSDQPWRDDLLRAIAKCAPQLGNGPQKGFARFQSLVANELQDDKAQIRRGTQRTLEKPEPAKPKPAKPGPAKPGPAKPGPAKAEANTPPSSETQKPVSGNVFRDALARLLSPKDD